MDTGSGEREEGGGSSKGVGWKRNTAVNRNMQRDCQKQSSSSSRSSDGNSSLLDEGGRLTIETIPEQL